MHKVLCEGKFKSFTLERIAEMLFDGFNIIHTKNCEGCK